VIAIDYKYQLQDIIRFCSNLANDAMLKETLDSRWAIYCSFHLAPLFPLKHCFYFRFPCSLALFSNRFRQKGNARVGSGPSGQVDQWWDEKSSSLDWWIQYVAGSVGVLWDQMHAIARAAVPGFVTALTATILPSQAEPTACCL